MPDTTTTSSAKRQRRIEKRCIAPVVAALHRGEISPRSADLFVRLSPKKQALELSRRLEESTEREARHQLVAAAIRRYLDNLGGQKVDLNAIVERIREALAFAKAGQTRGL